jgi:hypothetical protein
LVGGLEQRDDGREVCCRERLLAGAHERVVAPSCLVACPGRLRLSTTDATTPAPWRPAGQNSCQGATTTTYAGRVGIYDDGQ